MGTWTTTTQAGGRRTRPSLVVAAALSLLAGLLAFSTPEAAAGGTKLPLLKGTTVISGTATAGMKVLLPRASRVDTDRLGRYIEVTGGGRMAGVILTGSDLKDQSRPFLAALRAGFCGAPGCAPKGSQRAGFGFYNGDLDSGFLTLPHGEYQLYVVADGAPVKATLRLPGLAGKVRLRPSQSVVSSVAEPPLGVGEGPGGAFYSGGESFDVKGLEGFSFNALRLKADAWGAGEVAHCIYDEAPPEPVAFAPGCPAGQNFPITDAVVTTIPYTRVYGSGVGRSGPGPMGHGVWYAAAAAVTEADDLSFFIDFAPLP